MASNAYNYLANPYNQKIVIDGVANFANGYIPGSPPTNITEGVGGAVHWLTHGGPDEFQNTVLPQRIIQNNTPINDNTSNSLNHPTVPPSFQQKDEGAFLDDSDKPNMGTSKTGGEHD